MNLLEPARFRLEPERLHASERAVERDDVDPDDLRGLLDEQVLVHLPGGSLVISWRGEGEPVWMTGPANEVFEGTIDL